MKNLYYRILRDLAAIKLMAALVASPDRYQYIAKQVEEGKLTNYEATQKNANKALLMADQLVKRIRVHSVFPTSPEQ